MASPTLAFVVALAFLASVQAASFSDNRGSNKSDGAPGPDLGYTPAPLGILDVLNSYNKSNSTQKDKVPVPAAQNGFPDVPGVAVPPQSFAARQTFGPGPFGPDAGLAAGGYPPLGAPGAGFPGPGVPAAGLGYPAAGVPPVDGLPPPGLGLGGPIPGGPGFGGIPPVGPGLGLGLPFFPGVGGEVSFGGYFPIVEKIIVVVGIGILLLVIMAVAWAAIGGAGVLGGLGGLGWNNDGEWSDRIGINKEINTPFGRGGFHDNAGVQLTNQVHKGIDKTF